MLCWLFIFIILAYKFPLFAVIMAIVCAAVVILTMIAVTISEDQRKNTYFLVEFEHDTLNKYYEGITKGRGIHTFRFMRDSKKYENDIGIIKFNSENKYFTVSLPLMGDFHEVLILSPETLSPVKIIPQVNNFTISCDPREFNSIQIDEGKYLIWVRTLGPIVPHDHLSNVRVSRDRGSTLMKSASIDSIDQLSNPQMLKEYAIECHHDNHRRMKISEYTPKELELTPVSPFIKAFQVEAEFAKEEIAYIFLENARFMNIFHTLYINGNEKRIFLSGNNSVIKVPITYENAGEDYDQDIVKIKYTQFLYDSSPITSSNRAKPFIVRYSKERSHFVEEF